MSEERPVVVVGGHSRLGQEIMHLLEARGQAIARRGDDRFETVVVPDYHAITAAHFAGAAAIVNCTGLVSGSQEALHQANAVLPALLAARSREAGVRRFVQVSSFSVYGHAEEVGLETPEHPVSDYGRTKLAGDRALEAASSDRFEPVLLRIPMLFDGSSDGKLAKLLRLVVRTRMAPAPKREVVRAMLSYQSAAAVILSLVDSDRRGVVLAADPTPFTYDLVAERAGEVLGRRIRRVPVPALAGRALEWLRPELYASLLKSSRLPNAANFVRETPPEAALPAVITRLVEKMASGSA